MVNLTIGTRALYLYDLTLQAHVRLLRYPLYIIVYCICEHYTVGQLASVGLPQACPNHYLNHLCTNIAYWQHT